LAAVLALLDPSLDVLALTPCAGCVTGSVATRNVQAIVAHLDPPKWPRLGSARGPAQLVDASPNVFEPLLGELHGPTGLGDIEFPAAQLHNPHDSVKVLVDLVRAHPHEITLLTLGPLGNVIAAAERAPDFLESLAGLVCCGGAISVGGDVTAAAETNMFLNPEAARFVVAGKHAKTLVPLDVTNKAVLTLEQFPKITATDSPASQFLSKLSFRTHRQLLGIESIRIAEVVALAVVARPQLVRSQPMPVSVETEGELTRGATVADRRPQFAGGASTEVVTEIDPKGVID
ncbi:MAG: nucleoside hydrolase, partial [Planctomycetota bacterium]|nr:nucleoside hydrolase [Planctomycetota bacterium]